MAKIRSCTNTASGINDATEISKRSMNFWLKIAQKYAGRVHLFK